MGKKYIGILGGTFDPPHSGHLSISNMSLKRLGLDEIWWVVTKRNPLKKKTSVYESRLKKVRNYLEKQRIKIYQFESEENIYTIDLIKSLKKNFPSNSFIWLMGLDNLKSFHLWKKWKIIFYNIPIAIFDRPFYSLNLYQSRALSVFRKKRINIKSAKKLKYMSPPKWVFLTGHSNSQSSTKLRKDES